MYASALPIILSDQIMYIYIYLYIYTYICMYINMDIYIYDQIVWSVEQKHTYLTKPSTVELKSTYLHLSCYNATSFCMQQCCNIFTIYTYISSYVVQHISYCKKLWLTIIFMLKTIYSRNCECLKYIVSSLFF
jgi:hypothetical protein